MAPPKVASKPSLRAKLRRPSWNDTSGSGPSRMSLTTDVWRSRRRSPLKRTGRLAGEREKEPSTPHPHPEQRHEENHRVDLSRSCRARLHVLQPESERELVRRERRPDAVE